MAQTATETTTEAHTEAAAGDHGGSSAFPPLDTSTYPSQLFWLILFFAALYLLMSRLVLPRLGKILDTRKARIDGDIARAQSLKEETEAALKAYEKSLADARGKATDIARETRETITKQVDAEQHKLDASLADKISTAEGKIAKSKAKAMDAVNDIASDAAADIIASLGGGKVAKTAIAKAISAVKR